MGRKNNREVEEQRTSDYVDIKDLYVKFLKKNFVKLEDFLKLTFFEVNSNIKAYNEAYEDTLLAFEGLANITGMTGFSRLKEPIVWVKRKNKIKIESEQEKLLQQYNSLFLN